MIRSAEFSEDRTYRYSLTRILDDDLSKPFAGLIGKNPSDADHLKDDPTVIKWMAFAQWFGWRGFIVVNMFDYIATDSNELIRIGDSLAVSDNNLAYKVVQRLIDAKCDPIVCCWGTHSNKNLRERIITRGEMIRRRLVESGIQPVCFKINGDGTPSHPLYLPLKMPLQPYGAYPMIQQK